MRTLMLYVAACMALPLIRGASLRSKIVDIAHHATCLPPHVAPTAQGAWTGLSLASHQLLGQQLPELAAATADLPSCIRTFPPGPATDAMVAKLAAGEPVTILVLGGSISAGAKFAVNEQGVAYAFVRDKAIAWPAKLEAVLQKTFNNPNVRVYNRAVSATGSDYAARNLRNLIGQEVSSVDAVLLESKANDNRGDKFSFDGMGAGNDGPAWEVNNAKQMSWWADVWAGKTNAWERLSFAPSEGLKSMEKFMLALRSLPKPPAVAVVDLELSNRTTTADDAQGLCSSRAALATHYGAATLDFGGGLNHHLEADKGEKCISELPHFCSPGHRAVASFVASAFARAATRWAQRQTTTPSCVSMQQFAERRVWEAQPALRLLSAAEAALSNPATLFDFQSDRPSPLVLQALVHQSQGFQFRADVKSKFGLLAETPGELVSFKVRTGPTGRVVLGLMKSYKNVGAGVAWVEHAGEKAGVAFDAQWPHHASEYAELEVPGGRPNQDEIVSIRVSRTGRPHEKLKLLLLAAY